MVSCFQTSRRDKLMWGEKFEQNGRMAGKVCYRFEKLLNYIDLSASSAYGNMWAFELEVVVHLTDWEIGFQGGDLTQARRLIE